MPEETSGLKVHYYNDGKEVYPAGTVQSFIGLSPVVFNQISFDVVGSNTKNVDIINMKVVDATPQSFFNALPSTPQSLSVGESNKLLWTSNLIDTTQFESMPQPITFWVNISGEDSYGNTESMTTSINLDIYYGQNPLIVDGVSITLGGDITIYDHIRVVNGGIIYVDTTNGYLNLESDIIYVDSTSQIIGTARSNFVGGNGGPPGPGVGSGCSCGGAGSQGSTTIEGAKGGGGGCNCYCGGAGGAGQAGEIPSTETDRYDFVSGAGAGGGGGGGGGSGESGQYGKPGSPGHPGERGGATIRLNAQDITINGDIITIGGYGGGGGAGGRQSDAGGCPGAPGGTGGGGSGGQIILDGTDIYLSGASLIADGGSGGYQGAGGRLKVFYSSLNTGGVTASVAGGKPGTLYYEQI